MKDELTINQLDGADLRLLDLLQDDSSLSNQALAAAVGISPATATRRLRRLRDGGVVERQTALISPALLPASLTAIAEVTLDRQGAEHLATFEQRAIQEVAVQQCYRVSPGPDFCLVLWLADMPSYHALVQRLFTADANVRNVRNFFSIHRAKFEPKLNLSPRQ